MPTPSKAALILKKQVDAGMIAQLEKALKLPRHSKRASPLQVKIAEKIAKKVNAQIEKALKPAEITINVTKFKNIFTVNGSLKNRSTRAWMDMKMKDHPRVRIDQPKPGKHEFDKLVIGPQGATLLFTIKPTRYYPVGITFVRNKGKFRETDRKRLGFLNFDQLRIRPDKHEHSVQVTDRFKEERLDKWYKFCVIIQEAKTGRIGIIDPDIVNEP